MIVIPAPVLQEIRAAAEAAYPAEACGLLVGTREEGGRWDVQAYHPSPNIAADPARRFEIDPRVHIGLLRSLRGGPAAIIGIAHSHPGHPAQPSATDLAAADDPDLAWVITSVVAGKAAETAAHRFDPTGPRFHGLLLRTS